MFKKILILIVELALMALVIYGIVTIFDSITAAEEHETVPWCVTEYKHE